MSSQGNSSFGRKMFQNKERNGVDGERNEHGSHGSNHYHCLKYGQYSKYNQKNKYSTSENYLMEKFHRRQCAQDNFGAIICNVIKLFSKK